MRRRRKGWWFGDGEDEEYRDEETEGNKENRRFSTGGEMDSKSEAVDNAMKDMARTRSRTRGQENALYSR